MTWSIWNIFFIIIQPKTQFSSHAQVSGCVCSVKAPLSLHSALTLNMQLKLLLGIFYLQHLNNKTKRLTLNLTQAVRFRLDWPTHMVKQMRSMLNIRDSCFSMCYRPFFFFLNPNLCPHSTKIVTRNIVVISTSVGCKIW